MQSLTPETDMRILLMLALALLQSACGSGGAEDAAVPEETAGAEIANDYNKAMDKALDVEALSFEHKDRLDAALQEAQGNKKKEP